MPIPYFHVDSFTSVPFRGNPAGVCWLERWLPDAVLQRMAAEVQLSETAFIVPKGDRFDLRWFSPRMEIDLCGHATLAAAFVLYRERRVTRPTIEFESKSGLLTVERVGDEMFLNFPARPPRPLDPIPEVFGRALGISPVEVWQDRDLIAVYRNEADVCALKPDFEALAKIDSFGFIATAPGQESDYVLRFFGPRAGIPEDPVTGSAQCELAPYWAAKLGKNRFTVRQVSERGGEMTCEVAGDRVKIGGRAVLYTSGYVVLDEKYLK